MFPEVICIPTYVIIAFWCGTPNFYTGISEQTRKAKPTPQCNSIADSPCLFSQFFHLACICSPFYTCYLAHHTETRWTPKPRRSDWKSPTQQTKMEWEGKVPGHIINTHTQTGPRTTKLQCLHTSRDRPPCPKCNQRRGDNPRGSSDKRDGRYISREIGRASCRERV